MKEYTINRYNTSIKVVEFHPSEYEFGLAIAEGERKSIETFKEELQADVVMNGTTFHTPDIKSIHFGYYKDLDQEINKPTTDKMTEVYFTPDNKMVIGTPPPYYDLAMSLLFPLVIDGKKNLGTIEQYSHKKQLTVRTASGQKKDGTMIWIRAAHMDGYTLGDLMVYLNCWQSACHDGGGSASLLSPQSKFSTTRPLGTVFYAKKLPIVTVKNRVNFDGKSVPGLITNEGRTYIEARTVSELIDKKISYDSKTKRVSIY